MIMPVGYDAGVSIKVSHREAVTIAALPGDGDGGGRLPLAVSA